jgi:hypothetical protein
MSNWIVGFDPFSETEQGWLVHRQAPEFVAKWSIESEDMAVLDDLVYSDGKIPDAIAVHAFDWSDEMPSEEVFRKTMLVATRAIEEFILMIDAIVEDET